jgi:uncharacterized membrane protein YoaK (UPF0700 family)
LERFWRAIDLFPTSPTSVSNSVIRTTHLTGVTTDLGIGLVRLLHRDPKDLKGFDDETHANLMRVGIILFFCLGSVFGGFVFKRLEYLGFFVPALTSGILFLIMFYFQVLTKRTPCGLRNGKPNSEEQSGE